MKIGEVLEDFKLNTVHGEYSLNDFHGYKLILEYSGLDAGVGLTELAFLNKHYEGFKMFGNNIICLTKQDVESLNTDVRLITMQEVYYPIASSDFSFVSEGEKGYVLVDRENKIVTINKMSMNIGYNLVEIFRIIQADLLKNVKLNTPCNWLGVPEMGWEGQEILDLDVPLDDQKKMYDHVFNKFGIRFVLRPTNDLVENV